MPFSNIQTVEDLLECLSDPVHYQYFEEYFFSLYQSSLKENNYRLTNCLLDEAKYLFLPGTKRTSYNSMNISKLFVTTASHKHFPQYFDLLYRNGYNPELARNISRNFENDLLSDLFDAGHYDSINYLIQKYDYPVVLNNSINCLHTICYEKNTDKLKKFLEFNIQFNLSADFFHNITNDNINDFFQCYTLLKEHPVYKDNKLLNNELLIQDSLLTIIYKNDLSHENINKIAAFMGVHEISTAAFFNKENNIKEQKGYGIYQNNNLKYMLAINKINALLDLGFKENFLKKDVDFENLFKQKLMEHIISSNYSHEELKKYQHFNLTETTDKGKYPLSDWIANSFYYFKRDNNLESLFNKFCFYFETDRLSSEQQESIITNFKYKHVAEEFKQTFNNHIEKLSLNDHIDTINEAGVFAARKINRL